jgi:hypothetical protein
MKVIKGLAVSILSFLLFLFLFTFGTMFMVNSTLLNPDFVTSEVDKLDIPQALLELADDQISHQAYQETAMLTDAAYKVISEQEPYIKQQLNSAIHSAYDFFLSKTDELAISISLEPLKDALRTNLLQSANEYGVATTLQLTQPQLETYVDQYAQEVNNQIPQEIAFNENSLSPEDMQLVLNVKNYLSYFQIGYYALIALMILMALGIILINRNLKQTSLSLGINLSLYGALEVAGIILARHYDLMGYMPSMSTPTLSNWLSGLANGMLSPMLTFGIGILIAGAVLIILSFFFKQKAEEIPD